MKESRRGEGERAKEVRDVSEIRCVDPVRRNKPEVS